MRSLWSSIITLAALLDVSRAIHIDLPRRSTERLPNLFSRAANGTAGLDYDRGGYFINITLGGQPFSVLIDTGSSDLWVAGTVPGAVDTGASAEILYAVGSAGGPVKTAPLNILGYTVQNQAFIEVAPASDAPEGTGLIGLGPSSGSRIFETLASSAGLPPLDRIFLQDTSIPNFISVLLSRPNDTAEQYEGSMTISEIVPEFQNISSQTKVPVTILQEELSNNQHFSILLDSNGIIGPDGNAIKVSSNASYAPNHDKSQLVVVLDTGFTLPQFPENVVDAIYSGIPGARKQTLASFSGDVWILDCKSEVNASIKIGGKTYPIHPLDLSRTAVDDSGNAICYGTFQPVIPGAQDPTFDGILGMSVLSNMYVLLNYGDFIDGSPSNTADPYIQFISTTDPAAAHADFVATRLEGKDTSGSQKNTGSGSSGSSGSSSKSFFQKYKYPLIASAAVLALGVISTAVFLVTRRRKNKKVYQPLFAPAPAGDMQMHYVAGYNPAQPPQYAPPPTGPQYADPWNYRR